MLSGEIPEDMLFSRSNKDYQALNLNLIHTCIQEIIPEKCCVKLDRGQFMPYDALLLATGAQAVGVKIPGVDLEGVFSMDTLEDARKIVDHIRKCRRGVVIGGGITALEIVEGLHSRGLETHYLLRKDRYWRGVLDPEESAIIEARLADQGIRLHHNSEVRRIYGKKGRVAGVELEGGESIPCDMLGIAAGIRPRMSLAVNAGLAVDRGVLVDEMMRTCDPRIFAAGDVAQVYDPVVDKHVLDSLWNTALEQGRVAGENMSGRKVSYRRRVPFNVTRLAGIVTTIIGTVGQGGGDPDLVAIARGDSEIWRARPEAFVAEAKDRVDRVRILGIQNQLVGAVVMGDQTLSRPLQHMIAEGVDIQPIRQHLLDEPESMCSTLMDYWESRKSQRVT
jgi:NAD(P)H-nitrite reductase large subunit